MQINTINRLNIATSNYKPTFTGNFVAMGFDKYKTVVQKQYGWSFAQGVRLSILKPFLGLLERLFPSSEIKVVARASRFTNAGMEKIQKSFTQRIEKTSNDYDLKLLLIKLCKKHYDNLVEFREVNNNFRKIIHSNHLKTCKIVHSATAKILRHADTDEKVYAALLNEQEAMSKLLKKKKKMLYDFLFISDKVVPEMLDDIEKSLKYHQKQMGLLQERFKGIVPDKNVKFPLTTERLLRLLDK